MVDSAKVPAGWYPDVTNGGSRYWDGDAWTDQRAAAQPEPKTRETKKFPLVTVGVGAIVLLLLIVSATSGIGSFVTVLGLVAVVTGIYVAITKRRSWALLPPSRALGSGLAVLGLIVALVGGGLHPWQPTPAAAQSVSTPTATPTNTAPTPTPTADSYQFDPASVPKSSGSASVVAVDASVTTGTAVDVLATLAVKGRAPKTGYDRVGDFGTAWIDVDANGCDTRNDILNRDLTGTTKSGTCTVLTGTLADPYTGKTINFVRGDTTSLAVQIDHVVALSDAWQTGAQQLTAAQRITLANDPLNLLAVDGPTNEAKGDGDAATWLPPNNATRCEYAARQISVKATYGLWVTQAEHDQLANILTTCPNQPAETSQFTPAPATPVTVPTTEPSVAAPADPAPAPVVPAPADPGSGSTYYANCAAARAAGAAPLHEGDPGYRSALDRDHDGVACEN